SESNPPETIVLRLTRCRQAGADASISFTHSAAGKPLLGPQGLFMFSQLGLSPTACVSLVRLGYDTPTPIQTEAIPLVLSGVDLLARAQTGTGTTAAFGLPMIERLLARESSAVGRMPAGLVLVPTRELAVQVHQALSSYAASAPLRLAAIFGGVAINRQVQVLRRGVDIVVATPGRLLD